MLLEVLRQVRNVSGLLRRCAHRNDRVQGSCAASHRSRQLAM